MKAPIYLSILLGLFAGCSSAPESTDVGLSSRPPKELVQSAVQESDEFKFCLSEEAGPESLKEVADRLLKVVEAMVDSVNASELAESKKAQLSQSIEALKTSCGDLAASAEGQATSSELSKANSKIRSELISVSKMLR